MLKNRHPETSRSLPKVAEAEPLTPDRIKTEFVPVPSSAMDPADLRKVRNGLLIGPLALSSQMHVPLSHRQILVPGYLLNRSCEVIITIHSITVAALWRGYNS